MKKTTACLLWIAACIWAGCTKPAHEEIHHTPKPATLANQSYGSHERQKMDIYLAPDRNARTPLVILLHGGAWVSGDKNDMRPFADSLVRNGCNAICINYRYANLPGVDYPQMMEDISAAISHTAANASQWDVRNTGYVLAGHSAGGHLALLYAHRHNGQNKVAATISLAGPTNLADDSFINYQFLIGNLGAIEQLVGVNWNFGTNKAPFEAASPYFGLRNIPTQLFYGESDLVVPVAQGQMLKNKLSAQGYRYEYTQFAGAGHDLGITQPANLDSVSKAMVRWVKTYGN